MKLSNLIKLSCAALVLSGSLFGLVAPASAIPITFDIKHRDRTFSLLHPENLGGGARNRYLYFDYNQTLDADLDLSTNIVTSTGPQTFSLGSKNSNYSAIFEVLDFQFDLNGPFGFAGGSLDYNLDVVHSINSDKNFAITGGNLSFSEKNPMGGLFNQSTLVDRLLTVYAWGGGTFDLTSGGITKTHTIGMDLGAEGKVPEPGTLLLLSFGLIGVGVGSVANRRRAK